MNTFKPITTPNNSHKVACLPSKHDWTLSLLANVTEDFFAVTKVDDGFELDIRLSVIKNNEITKIFLYSIKHGDEIKLLLEKIPKKNHDIWHVKVTIENEAMLNPFSYRFKIITEGNYLFFDSQGTYKYRVSNSANFKFFYNANTPEWLTSASVYHIFIDRFKKILPPNENEKRWDISPTDDAHEFYGGDLLGVIDQLDYLQNLGINTICLTPIFKSSTNHKYDIEDYFQVDDRLGGNDAFSALCKACKCRNMKIILDGVFNHVSGRSQWFNRDGVHATEGAFQSLHSAYSSFFNFQQHPAHYDAFWGEPYLPKLNYQSSELRNIVYKNEDSIIKYWMQEPYCIDGWRLDAGCMIGKYHNINLNSEILTELYSEAKSSKEDCYIFGENPFDPSEVAQYKHLDGITNYSGFYSPLVYWLDSSIDFNADDFDAAITEFRALLGSQFLQTCKNFIGNHDKKRLYSLLDCDSIKYFIALTFLFTYPGVPALYYGEEIGLHDKNAQNDGRISMQWGSWSPIQHSIFNFTKKLIALYKSSSAIQKGGFRTLQTKNDIFIYERFLGDELVIIILNNSGQAFNALTIETYSIARLSIRNFYSYLDSTVQVMITKDNTVKIANIRNNNPIVITSKPE